MGPTSYARTLYTIAYYMIERHGERASDVLEGFVTANQGEEDIETKALWADVRIAVRVLTSAEACRLTPSPGSSSAPSASCTSNSLHDRTPDRFGYPADAEPL